MTERKEQAEKVRPSARLLDEGPGRSDMSSTVTHDRSKNIVKHDRARYLTSRSAASRLKDNGGSGLASRHLRHKGSALAGGRAKSAELSDASINRIVRKMTKRERMKYAAEIALATGDVAEPAEGEDDLVTYAARRAAAVDRLRRVVRDRGKRVQVTDAPTSEEKLSGVGKDNPRDEQSKRRRAGYGPKEADLIEEAGKAASEDARAAEKARPSSRLLYGDEPYGSATRKKQKKNAAGKIKKVKARKALVKNASVKKTLKNQVIESAQTASRAATVHRAEKAVKATTYTVKAAAGAIGAGGVAMVIIAIVLSLLLALTLLADDFTAQPETLPNGSLPEAVEKWRSVVEEACKDIFGDTKWTDMILAMMAQESGGNIDIASYDGAHDQDLMQAKEGAYGSWIRNGYAPYNLLPSTARASIYAGTAEFKQNLNLWSDYLGGIEPHEVDKLKLVVQGYNYGAVGYYNWNKSHGYKSWTLQRSQNYSDTRMPAGAKGTPAHADYVMRYYSYGASADGNLTVQRAYQELGKPYLWGAVGPNSYDCSGLVSYCLTGKHERIGTTETFAYWTRVTNPVPGDICLNSHHTGIYIGGGKMIHAPHTGDVVKISDVHVGMYYVRYKG